jgi:hypothetical protein
MLKVTGVQDAAEALCLIDMDPYVPISFRSQSEPFTGARYITLGDSKGQLLELQLPPESMALSGFTVVLADTSERRWLSASGPVTEGLPIIELPHGAVFDHLGYISSIEFPGNVWLSCSDAQAGARVEVDLGCADTFDRRIVHGRIQFLVSEDILVGLRVVDLTDIEQQLLRVYVEERRRELAR